MITEELLSYIKSQLQSEDAESVKNRLRSAGWSEEDVIQAFSLVANNNTGVSVKSESTRQMEPSDFWTHICTVIIAFLTSVLPGSIMYGFTLHTLIYIGGAVAVILLAIIWRVAKL